MVCLSVGPDEACDGGSIYEAVYAVELPEFLYAVGGDFQVVVVGKDATDYSCKCRVGVDLPPVGVGDSGRIDARQGYGGWQVEFGRLEVFHARA